MPRQHGGTKNHNKHGHTQVQFPLSFYMSSNWSQRPQIQMKHINY